MKLEIIKPKAIALRQKGWTYKKIGDKYGITMERVRQILNYHLIKCQKHKLTSIGICIDCVVDNGYAKDINKMDLPQLQMEGIRLSKLGRERQTVLQRRALIKCLKNKHKLNFNRIAGILKRDRKAITNQYFK